MSRWFGLLLAVLGGLVAGKSYAQPAPTPSASAAPMPSPQASASTSSRAIRGEKPPTKTQDTKNPATNDPELDLLRVRREHIEALLAGKLDIGVEPQTLFSVALGDNKAIAIECRRLRRVLAAEEKPSPEKAGGGNGAQGGNAGTGGAGGAGGGSDAATATPKTDGVDAARWLAQLKLDRATLSFLELSGDKREAKLAIHRKAKDAAGDQARQERQAREQRIRAERERLAAIAAEKAAKDAISRLFGSERRKLADAQLAISKLSEKRAAESRQLVQDAQRLLDTEQRCSALLERRKKKQSTALEADEFYDELVQQLHRAQQSLETLLDTWERSGKAVTALPPSELAKVANQLDSTWLDQRKSILRQRAKLQRTLADEQRAEVLHHKARVRASADKARRLNKTRLAIFPYLSATKQQALSSLESSGRRQAGSEIAQIVLVLRYHAAASMRWLRALGRENGTTNRTQLYWTMSQWILAIAFFVWWRKRIDRWLEAWSQRLAENRRRNQRRHQGVRLLRRVRGPAEWLLLFYALQRMLPRSSQNVLEVSLAGSVVAWMVGESLVVEGIDALASQRRKKHQPNAELRLHSLRFIGRIVVAFGLTLSLSRQLVGEGTIYSWIATLCWIAPLPMSLILVRWWQDQIFERINLRKRHTTLTAWIVSHEEGWLRLPAAFVGGIYLTIRATNRVARHWLSQSDFSRRILAYWFRREVSRKEQEEDTPLTLRPISKRSYAQLDPGKDCHDFIAGVADEQLARIIKRVHAPGGGVFAIVGERGAGKSTLLRQILADSDCDLVRCPPGGAGPFLKALRKTLGAGGDADFAELQAMINARSSRSGILVDDAHHLIRPVIGGLDDFDRILELARNSSIRTCTWVFSIDRVIWQFFKRARGAKPIFDDVIVLRPWSEENITKFLRAECDSAGLQPRFDLLLRDLPDDADELDRNDAYNRVETNTYRWLWDYSNGNPAVALEFWRQSLFIDADDENQVRLVPTPDTTDLEQLTDEAIFVLRAVIQLDLAAPIDVAAATLLSSAQVADALRYAESRGYVEVIDGRYHVRWQWLRAITNVLERRHLLVRTS